MKDETRQWLTYAKEAVGAAGVVLQAGYFNACLQNCQQAVEKALKCLLVEFALEFRKTHHILELKGLLEQGGIHVNLPDDDCHLLDTIYLPSRYPIGGALPDVSPDSEICQRCLTIANQVLLSVRQQIKDR